MVYGILGGTLVLLACTTACAESSDSVTRRHKMVEQQIVARGIEDLRVLRAMKDVPRHRFVPEPLRGRAYEDGPLPIGEGQTISQPYIVAIMTAVLELEGDERVLEIGTGSGYQAAILARVAREVFTIEIREDLSRRAQALLGELGAANLKFRVGDGYLGWPEAAPFDAIIVTAAPPEIPEALIDQLAMGGRMIVPVGENVQELTLVVKTPNRLVKRSILPVRFVPMIPGAPR